MGRGIGGISACGAIRFTHCALRGLQRFSSHPQKLFRTAVGESRNPAVLKRAFLDPSFR
jgi:hypothetical protein